MVENRKLLHVAPFFCGSTAVERLKVFHESFGDVAEFDIHLYIRYWDRGLISLWRGLFFSPVRIRLNIDLCNRINEYQPDVIFFEKSIYVSSLVILWLKFYKKVRLVHFSPDDYFNPRNTSVGHIFSLRYFDSIVTTKLHNLSRLRYLFRRSSIFHVLSGAPSRDRYGPYDFKYSISFVGQFEQSRFDSLRKLASVFQVDVFGPDWPDLDVGLRVHESVWGEDYYRVLCESEINLCFLRKENRDSSTNRTFEIAAVGGLMVAEDSDEHRELFASGHEALYFSDDVELVEQIHKIMAMSEYQRSKFRTRIRARFENSGYSYSEIWGRFWASF